MYEKFFKYKEKVEEDLKFDDFTIKEVSMKLPMIKHFWVGKLIETKIDLEKLNSLKYSLIKTLQSSNDTDIPIKVSKETLMKKLNSHPKMIEIYDQIKEHELIIEYLEKTEKIFSATSFDLKNTIELMKLEQL